MRGVHKAELNRERKFEIRAKRSLERTAIIYNGHCAQHFVDSAMHMTMWHGLCTFMSVCVLIVCMR